MLATSPLHLTHAPSPDVPDASPHPASRVEGRLSLSFVHSETAQRTSLRTIEQQPPLQVIRAFPLGDRGVLTHVHNISGGILSGDRLHLKLEVGPGARAQVTSTGATRVYRRRAGRAAAVQTITARVAPDGLLEYLPDPLIPFSGASYRQHTRIELQPGAGLFWWETVAPGREALGECFVYESLEMTFDLRAAGEPAALEHFKLEPCRKPLASAARLGPYRHFTSFYVCRPGVSPACWMNLESRLAETAHARSRPGETVWGTSTLTTSGLVVRGLSLTGRALASGLHTFWQIAKQELYGRAALLPRKLS